MISQGPGRMRWALLLGALTTIGGCRAPAEIRVHNASALDFADVRVGSRAFGTVEAGATSAYRPVRLHVRYAVVRLRVGGREVTGQTLNLGSDRFTYRIDIVDLDAGHLAIEVVRE